jgi:hypothetical protein
MAAEELEITEVTREIGVVFVYMNVRIVELHLDKAIDAFGRLLIMIASLELVRFIKVIVFIALLVWAGRSYF